MIYITLETKNKNLLFEKSSSDLYILFDNSNQIYLFSNGLATEGTFVIV